MAFQDIEDVLYTLSSSVAVDLLFSILEEFGALIYGRVRENFASIPLPCKINFNDMLRE